MRNISCPFSLTLLLVSLLMTTGHTNGQMETTRPQMMCKVFLSSYRFNLEVADKVRRYTGYRDDGQKFTILAKLCTHFTLDDLKTELRLVGNPNGIGIDYDAIKPNVVFYCPGCPDNHRFFVISRLYSKGSYMWEAGYKPPERVSSSGTNSKGNIALLPLQQSMITFFTKAPVELILKTGEDNRRNPYFVAFENICDPSRTTTESEIFIQNINYQKRKIVFKYVGAKACQLDTPNLIVFLSRNFMFLFVLFSTSLAGLLLTRDHERIAMALAGTQASTMIITFIFLYNGEYGIISSQSGNAQLHFGLATFVAAFVTFGFSFFSRVFSLVFVSIAFAYAIVSTVLYLFTLMFQTFLTPYIYVCGVVLVCIGLGIMNYFSKQVQEKYSFIIYTSVTSSFFLCLAIFIAIQWYLDVMNFNRYPDFGKKDEIKIKNWIFLIIQFGLTSALITLKLRKEMMTTLSAIKQNANLFSERFANHDAYDPFADKGVNETIIAM